MTKTPIGRACAVIAFVLAVAAYAVPAAAQSGQLKGKVTDAQNKAVEGARILMEATDTGRKFETKTNGKGEFVQIGLPPGNYNVTATKEKLTQMFPVRVGLDQKEVNFVLKAAAEGGAASAEDVKKDAARRESIKTTFAEGATLTNEGKYDEAIAKFNAVIAEIPKCSDCYNNLGAIYTRKQEWDKAEEAFKKAIELAPDNVEAYNGLATIYNAQKKFKEAQAMSAEANKRLATGGGAGNAGALYNAARHFLELERFSQGARAADAGRENGSGTRRLAFHAGQGAHQSREARGSSDGVRDLSETRTDRPERQRSADEFRRVEVLPQVTAPA